MIIPACSVVTGYDPKDGTALWTSNGPSTEFIATPVFSDKAGLLLCASSWPARILVAIKPDGNGNVTKQKVVWQTKEGASYVPSPIAVGDYFLTTSAKKELSCYEAISGQIAWKQENVYSATNLAKRVPLRSHRINYLLPCEITLPLKNAAAIRSLSNA